jgi:prevent-host-death family protein
MTTVSVSEAKTQLSRLLERVSQGEEIVISRYGKPVATLVLFAERPVRRSPGSAKGQVSMYSDFDDSFPEEVLQGFEG